MVLKSFLHGSLSVLKKNKNKNTGWLLLYHKQNWHAYLVLHQNTPCHEKYFGHCAWLLEPERHYNMVYKYEIEKGELRGKKTDSLSTKNRSASNLTMSLLPNHNIVLLLAKLLNISITLPILLFFMVLPAFFPPVSWVCVVNLWVSIRSI